MKTAMRLLALLMFLNILLVGCQKAPADASAVKVRTLTMGVGAPLPDAEDFVTQMPEGWTVRFAKDYYRTFSSMGEQSLALIATDQKGRECTIPVKLRLVKDTEPPVILGAADLSACLGDGIAYRSGITVSDNCDGDVKLTVDSSAVNQTVEGSYPVIYTATDAVGNTATVTVTLYLYKERVTEEMLYAVLDPIIESRIPTSGRLELQVREIYDYVYYNIEYATHSDKSDWVRAAYEGLRTGQGDCYTYFALSKAFFERLNIENMDIQRTPGIVDERHYWNYVNIGNAANPRWYHFDACQLIGVTYNFGCLLTDAQVKAYTAYRTDENGVGNYFYAYDNTRYPTSHTTIITETPAWDS